MATMALLLGAVTAGAAYSQSPGYPGSPGSPDYGSRPESRPSHDYDQDHDRGYDDERTPRADVGFFYDELSPYGDWVQTRDYGWAWFPRSVHPYWRPYTDGRWVTTEYGWTWASNEPFGWATYHYGRWERDPRFGWLWVPGTVWGPAWVSWQYGGGYVGWAPLPPSVGFEANIGIRLGAFDFNIGIRPDAYSFVPERSFLEARVSGYLIPSARNVTIIHNTTNITNYTYVDNRVVNRGVEVRRIEQVTGRHVRSLRVADARSKTRTEVAESELRIYRPDRQRLDSVHAAPRPNEVTRSEAPPAVRAGRTPDFEVAPRPGQVPRTDARQSEKQDRRAQQELDRYQADEKRQLEKVHRQEIAKARAQADRSQVEQHHQAEREALQQEQKNAAQQLETRQKAQRQAAQQQENKKDKGQPQKKENGNGRGHKNETRPPG
jgi:hypothetical protein